MALTMDTVASVKGLTVTTTQGYTLTRIGNKSLREGDTIYTDGKYVYGMEGSGGKQLPMLPSMNYLFFVPASPEKMGIYGFYPSFNKPVFVCNAELKAIFMGANDAYQGTNKWNNLENVVNIASGKEIVSSYSDDYNVWTTGVNRPGLDQCVSRNGDYLELRAGQKKTRVTNEPFGTQFDQYLDSAILFKNGEIVDSPITSKWYGNNDDNCAPFWGHINEDGSYQCLCHGYLDRAFWDINHNDDYCDMSEETWGENIVERKELKFPPTPPVGANALESKDDGKFHLYKDTESGTEEIFSASSIDAICAYKDSSGRKPFTDAYFALGEFKRYTENILWKYDSTIGKREKISYTVTERRFYQCEPTSDELPINGATKRYILCYHENNVYRNGKYVPIYKNIAMYENTETGFWERYWFCTDEYNDYPLKRDDVYNHLYRYSTKPVDVQVGTDRNGNPIMMTYFEDDSVYPADITYTCCGYISDAPITNAVQINGNRYALLTSGGIVVVNKATGESKKVFNGGIGYYNTRLIKTSRNVINTIKRVLPKKGGD